MMITACTGKPDFSKVKDGMKSADVVKLVGVPNQRRNMNMAQWWLYTDKDSHVVVISADTVANCLTKKEAIKIMTETLNAFDSLRK